MGESGWQDFKRKRDAPISGRGVWVWKIATDPSASPVTVHTRVPSNGILPMLRIPNRQNLLSELYRTEFSVQKIPTCELLPFPPAPPAVPQRKYPSRHVSAVFHELHRAARRYIWGRYH